MTTQNQVYPFTDEYGYTWIDPSGMFPSLKPPLNKLKCPCFICGRMTARIDIDYQGYFCNSYACNLTIEFQLKEITI